MIKIIFYLDIAFFYSKANILRRWSNILSIWFNGNKGLCHGCRSHCFGLLYLAFEQLLYSNLCCVSVQDSRGCLVYEHIGAQLFAFFFWLRTYTCWTAHWLGQCWRWLTLTELADSRNKSLETQTQIWNWLRQRPHITHCYYTGSRLPTNSTLLAEPDVSTMAEQLHSAAITLLHSSIICSTPSSCSPYSL